jgi:tellurium resistance protein TerZ
MAAKLLKFDLRQNLFRIPSTLQVTNFVGAEPVDLDASAVCFDENGVALEAVFFNNLQCPYMTHSGDNTTGEDTGDDDERITVDLANVPSRVMFMMVCVTSYTGADFTLVERAGCRLYNDKTKEVVGEFHLGVLGRHTATILCVMSRVAPTADDPNSYWDLRELNIPCMGFTFFDVMDKMLEILSIPEGDARLECLNSLPDYSLEKSKLDSATVLGQMKLGLGWDGENDLDAILVMLNSQNEYYDHVYAKHGKLQSRDGACIHSGDKLNGYDVEGDDEFVTIDVHKLHPDVHVLFFIVTHFSGVSLSFGDVPNSYVRVQNKPSPVDLLYREIDRFAVSKVGGDHTGLILSSITRKGLNVFEYKKLHELTDGRDWIDVFPLIRCLASYRESPDLAEWLRWKNEALNPFAVEVNFIEARGLAPLEPHHFSCHCEAWVMDKKCIGPNRAYRTPIVTDRENVKWTGVMEVDGPHSGAAPVTVATQGQRRRANITESAIFLVTQIDRIRIMLFEFALVGFVDLELAKLTPQLFAGETIDSWMTLKGVDISGELRVSIRHVPAKYHEVLQARTKKPRSSSSWCSVM